MKLEDLFRWSKELQIVNTNNEPVMDGDKPIVLYQRIIGEADLNEARTHALKSSRLLRKKLKNIDSPERNALVPDPDDIDKETLIGSILNLKFLQFRDEALRVSTPPQKPVEPEHGAPLEDFEEYENAVAEYDSKANEVLVKTIETITERERKNLENSSIEETKKEFINNIIDALCRGEMTAEFNKYCSYLGTYLDKKFKTRAFSSFEEFDNSAPFLIRQIVDSYLALELNMETVKK